MKINIVSIGRFHVADLAICLTELGHDVTFISDVPQNRLRRFGLASATKTVTIWPATVLTLLQRGLSKLGITFPSSLLKLKIQMFDLLAGCTQPPCDVLIGMSGIVLYAGKQAQKRFASEFWLERGSRHILSQKRILDSRIGLLRSPILKWEVDRELAGYECANRVVIPSQQVAQSFLDAGFNQTKLFRNPYGTDLNMFPWTPCPQIEQSCVLMVGTWSWQKGCDLLESVAKRLPRIPFTHVGAIGDVEFPRLVNLRHYDAVNQYDLGKFYTRASVLVLLSRQEGLSTVMLQGLASGLLLVCTEATGGQDLKDLLEDSERITVIPNENLDDAILAIATAFAKSKHLRNAALDTEKRERLSWKRYGKNYNSTLLEKRLS